MPYIPDIHTTVPHVLCMAPDVENLDFLVLNTDHTIVTETLLDAPEPLHAKLSTYKLQLCVS